MPLYEVYITETNRGTLIVEAENEDEALDLAKDQLHDVDWHESEIQDMLVTELEDE
jgi:hypothetical protein